MDYCPSCGSEVADGTRQCPHCGAVVDDFAPVPDEESAGSPLDETPAGSAVESAVLETAAREGKIAAIKRYRMETNSGLKEAKEAVEALLREHGVQPRSGSGCAGVLLLLLLLAGLWLGLPL